MHAKRSHVHVKDLVVHVGGLQHNPTCTQSVSVSRMLKLDITRKRERSTVLEISKQPLCWYWNVCDRQLWQQAGWEYSTKCFNYAAHQRCVWRLQVLLPALGWNQALRRRWLLLWRRQLEIGSSQHHPENHWWPGEWVRLTGVVVHCWVPWYAGGRPCGVLLVICLFVWGRSYLFCLLFYMWFQAMGMLVPLSLFAPPPPPPIPPFYYLWKALLLCSLSNKRKLKHTQMHIHKEMRACTPYTYTHAHSSLTPSLFLSSFLSFMLNNCTFSTEQLHLSLCLNNCTFQT